MSLENERKEAGRMETFFCDFSRGDGISEHISVIIQSWTSATSTRVVVFSLSPKVSISSRTCLFSMPAAVKGSCCFFSQ